MTDQADVNRTDQRMIERVVDVGLVPTDGVSNASYVLAYTDGKLTTVTKTLNSIDYEVTLSWTGDDLTGVTVWSEV